MKNLQRALKCLIPLCAIYICACAVLNHLNKIENMNPIAIISMVVISTVAAIFMTLSFIRDYDNYDGSKKAVVFMDVALTFMWNIILVHALC